MSSPTDPLRDLREAVRRITKPLGARLMGMSFHLIDGRDDFVGLRFEIAPDQLVKTSTKEQKKFDDEFDAIIGGIDFNTPPPEAGMTLEPWEDE